MSNMNGDGDNPYLIPPTAHTDKLEEGTVAQITPENVQQVMEDARLKYIQSIQKIVIGGVTNSYTSITLVNEMLFAELDFGSKELVVYRELFFLLGKGLLTKEKWVEATTKLQEIKDAKLNADKELQTRVNATHH